MEANQEGHGGATGMALITAAAAGCLTVAAWDHAASRSHFRVADQTGLMAGVATAALIMAVMLAFRFPIYVRTKTNVYTNSVPLFLLAALLSPALAGLAAGVGQGAGELFARKRTRTPWHYTVCQSSRWVIIALVGSYLGHLSFGGPLNDLTPLAVAAAAMLLCDILTAPLVLMPITRERPVRTIRSVAKEASLPEGAQYLIGILGAVVAREELALLILLALPTILVYQAFKRARDMQISTQHFLERLADTVDLRDPYTGGHSRRVTEYTKAALRQLGVGGSEMDLIISAARVHDIGKLGVPDQVLNKPDKLTDEEWAIMATHPDQGAELLSRYPDFVRGVDIVRHHHERWDGAGYPHRLKGSATPFGARVIAVADAFDAMTSDRPYRSGMTVARALEVLLEGRGRQWEGRIVDALVHAVEDGQVTLPSREPAPSSAWMQRAA